MNLDCPRRLPVTHLSHSSINTYLGCPERWRRRYLELEYEPTNQKMLVGKVVGRSVTAGYLDKMTSGVVNLELLLDTFSTEWEDAASEEVDWEGEQPGVIKDAAAVCLDAYATTLMQDTTPTAVEEGFEIVLPGAQWSTIGYMDWLDDLGIGDLKVSGRAKSQADLDFDAQATMYVAAKQTQGEGLKPFRWHAIKRPSPAGRTPAFAVELNTTRTQVQVNSMLERIALVAREIDRRVVTGDWQGAAPGYWLCGARTCGFWDSCRFGGLR